jgi:hypothetical protein
MLKLFIVLTGAGDVGAGMLLFFPSVVFDLGLVPPVPGFWSQLAGLFLITIGIILILCVMDLEKRAFIVYWDGILRISAFFFFVYWGLFDELGLAAVFTGIGDLAIGLVYCIGLPKALDAKPVNILLGKNYQK